MIYAASLGLPVKKAYKEKAMQSSTARINALLSQSPSVSQMDCVVLGPKDCVGLRVKQLQQAVKSAHPEICIIYIYNKDAEEGTLDVPNKFKCKKITTEVIHEAIDSFLEEHVIRTGGATVSSKDFQSPDSSMIDGFFDGSSKAEEELVLPDFPTSSMNPRFSDPNEEIAEETPVPVYQEPVDTDDRESATLPVKPLVMNAPDYNPLVTKSTSEYPTESLMDNIENVASTEDWDMFTARLNRDSIVKRLIEENTAYTGLINMIDTLDYEIEVVWRDTALTSDMKFDKIKDIGLRRSSLIAAGNNITAEKIINTITKITLSAKRTVEKEIAGYNSAIGTIIANKKAIADDSHITEAMEQRAEIQFKLLMLCRKIMDLYKRMDNLVTEEIQSLDSKLPSSNEFINNMVKPIGTKIFTPTNTAELANKLMQALQANRMTASALDAQVRALIDVMFELFDKDREIIDYQRRLISMLRANKVEDIIIAETVLKRCLRIYTGADGTGRSATAITWSGILSRRQNSLLVDLTGKSKFKEYGIKPMTMEDFMSSRTEQRFLCVETSDIPTPEQLQDIVSELKTRLNYYPYINIIVDPEDISGINQLSVDALTMHYVCNCSLPSMKVVKDVIAKHTYNNIARRIIMIEPPISPLSIIDSLEADPTLFAITTLPMLPEIRACALRHDRPYEIETVVKVFEEAFR